MYKLNDYGIYFTLFTVQALIAFLFCYFGGFIFLSVREKSKATFHLGITFILFGIIPVGYLLASSHYHSWTSFLRLPVAYASIFAALHVILSFLNYPKSDQPVIPARVLKIGYAVAIFGFALFLYAAREARPFFHVSAHYYDLYAPVAQLSVSICIVFSIFLFSTVGIYRALKIRGKEGAVLFGYLASFLLATVVPAGSLVLVRLERINFGTFMMFFLMSTIIGLFFLALIYFNTTKECTTVMTRVSAIGIMGFFMLLQFVSKFSMDRLETSFDAEYFQRSRLFVLAGQRSSDMRYSCVFPAGSSDSQDSAKGCPDDRMRIRERYNAMRPAERRAYREDANGVRYIAYFVPDPEKGVVHEVGFDYLAYRRYVHPMAFYFILTILAAFAFVFLGYRLFYRGALIRPLHDLLEGLGRVQEGNLEVRLDVKTQDELGVISRSFNSMVDSIREARLSLEQKNADLTRLDRLKDEFLANTSHELRTPLNGIIGLADSMLDGAAGAVTDAQRKNLDMIHTSGRRLANLVNDILDFSKLRNKDIALRLQSVDARQIAEIVLDLSKSLIAGKNIQLINDVPEGLPPVLADEDRLQQIFFNLVGNAIKFTHAGAVRISARQSDGHAEISVADSGIGIPEDKFDAIFQSFEQVDASISREYGGTGLGLSVTKHLVELHGGSIRVNSRQGEGSTFTFTLPTSDRPVETKAQAAENLSKLDDDASTKIDEHENVLSRQESVLVSSFAGGRVLIVDDEPVNLQVLSNILGLQNCDVRQAESGDSALRLIGQDGWRPDIVVLDVMMPRMNGYEVCRRIREMHAPNELPVLLLTAKNQVADLVEGLDSGANDYLTKPFSKNELLARIKTHLHLLKINDAASRFVPREFLKFLGKESIVDVRLGDQVQREMTVLFSDIRSFTKLSETMTPKENFDFINAMLARIGPVIRKKGGFIDKYIGDAVMALFPGSPSDAVEAALEMRAMLRTYNERRRRRGYAPVETGTGIHTGMLMLGTIGESERMDSTVISDAVNLASRLEGLTKEYDCGIIISEAALLLCKERGFAHREIDIVRVKGKAEPVRVFEVL